MGPDKYLTYKIQILDINYYFHLLLEEARQISGCNRTNCFGGPNNISRWHFSAHHHARWQKATIQHPFPSFLATMIHNCQQSIFFSVPNNDDMIAVNKMSPCHVPQTHILKFNSSAWSSKNHNVLFVWINHWIKNTLRLFANAWFFWPNSSNLLHSTNNGVLH